MYSDKADFKYVFGADLTRRALEIAAAGGHSINLIGQHDFIDIYERID